MAELLRCAECDEPMADVCGGEMVTLVWYASPPGGHNHDDNCRKKYYQCKNKHGLTLSRRNTCPVPDCDWKGKETCFCHPGAKVNEWPPSAPVTSDHLFLPNLF